MDRRRLVNSAHDWDELSEDLRLAVENLEKARAKLGGSPFGDPEEIGQIVTGLFWEALPYFIAGVAHTPVHHNTQVLDNMVAIGLKECRSGSEFKNAIILALLHDIGNALSEGRKVKSDEAKSGDVNSAQAAVDAVAFRLEHMEKGPALAYELLQPLVAAGKLTHEDVHFVCRAVAIHDYPTVAESEKKIPGNEHLAKEFLFRFHDTSLSRLVKFLREADRLYMVTEQGVLKDLADDHKKRELLGWPPTSGDVQAKLKKNAEKHQQEYQIYKAERPEVSGFKNETLYRTETGYLLFEEFQREVMEKYPC